MMEDNIDMNMGKIITDGASLEEMGNELFDEIEKVANGKKTKAETLGHREFGIFKVSGTF